MYFNHNGMITIVIEWSNMTGWLNKMYTQQLVYSQYCEVVSISYWWKGIIK